jgi:hypothetical protein
MGIASDERPQDMRSIFMFKGRASDRPDHNGLKTKHEVSTKWQQCWTTASDRVD